MALDSRLATKAPAVISTARSLFWAATKYLETIRERAMFGAELVEKLSKIDAPKPPFDAKPVSLDCLLKDTLAEIQQDDQRILWEISSDKNGVNVSLPNKTLVEALRQIVATIISALPKGGTLGLTTTGIARGRRTVRITARPKSSTQKIGSDSILVETAEDMGLGAGRARSMIRDMGGELSSSRSSDGSLSFLISFPDDMNEGSGSASLRILVVDDEDTVRDVLVDMTDLMGHNVQGVPGGHAALEALELKDFDVVISDIGMPEMNGAELVSEIRKKWPALPIVIVSGWGMEECAQILKHHDRVWVLEKPVRIPDLRAFLSEISKLERDRS